MVYPVHLKKLASVVGSPWQYFQVVHSIVNAEQFSDLKLAIFEELGFTYDCDELLFQLTKDILCFQIDQSKTKPKEGVIAQFNFSKFEQFIQEIISMNAPCYHLQLNEYCEAVKISSEDSELVKFV